MLKRLRPQYYILGAPLLVAGCAAPQTETRDAIGDTRTSSISALLHGAGRSVEAARAFDRLSRAVENKSRVNFHSASNELKQLDAWPQVQRIVRHLIKSSDSTVDADLLNDLGYELAEKGIDHEQFVAAEEMTRRALEIYNAVIQAVGERSGSEQESERLLTSLRRSRASIRDSVAWSLYRQGRFEEALQEQKLAVLEAIASAGGVKERVSPELLQHLREITRARELEKLNEKPPSQFVAF